MFVLVHAVLQDFCPRAKLMSRSIADPDQDRAQVLVPSSQVTELFCQIRNALQNAHFSQTYFALK